MDCWKNIMKFGICQQQNPKRIESEPVYNENSLKAKLRSEEGNEASVFSIYLSNGNID